MDCERRSGADFFAGFVFRTLEGWLFIGGSILCVAWGILIWLSSSLIPEPGGPAAGLVLGFLLMPVLLLAVLVNFSQWGLRTSWHTRVTILIATGMPFYAAYLR
jgi:hypothetical protein